MFPKVLSLVGIFVVLSTFTEINGELAGEQFQTKKQLGNKLSQHFLVPDHNDKINDKRVQRKRRQVPEYHTSEPYQYNVIYVIDSSSSIKNVDFKLALKAIEHLTRKARKDTKYAAILFASYAQVVSKFTSSSDIMKKLQSVKRLRGGTNIYDALVACKELFTNPGSGRNPNALNRILVITDGLYNLEQSKTLSLAHEIKQNNTEIFVVAVGHYIYGLDEISFLASSQESHVFRVKTMEGLFDVTKWIPHDFYNGDQGNDGDIRQNNGNSDASDVW